MISESTYERVKDEFVCMEVDSFRVKGKSIPVKIYQLLAHTQAGRKNTWQGNVLFCKRITVIQTAELG